jgi:hypothetical protein
MSSAKRPSQRLTLAASANLTGKTEVGVAVARALELGDMSELAPIFRSRWKLTPEDHDLLLQFVEGNLARGRGAPKKKALGIIEGGSPAQRATNLINYDLSEKRKRGENVRGKQKELLEKYAEICGVNDEEKETIRNALKRRPKKVAPK